jgi:hypothetical protein
MGIIAIMHNDNDMLDDVTIVLTAIRSDLRQISYSNRLIGQR